MRLKTERNASDNIILGSMVPVFLCFYRRQLWKYTPWVPTGISTVLIHIMTIVTRISCHNHSGYDKNHS